MIEILESLELIKGLKENGVDFDDIYFDSRSDGGLRVTFWRFSKNYRLFVTRDVGDVYVETTGGHGWVVIGVRRLKDGESLSGDENMRFVLDLIKN